MYSLVFLLYRFVICVHAKHAEIFTCFYAAQQYATYNLRVLHVVIIIIIIPSIVFLSEIKYKTTLPVM